MEALITESEAAEQLSLSRSFLKQARVKGTGPAFIKIGRAVRYRICDLSDWVSRNARVNTIQSRRRG
jgi:predicted DNA-binding transcriptional regulator AlpA